MSSRKFRIELSAMAQSDIDGILAYTLETWGERQLEEYARILDRAFQQMEREPETRPLNFPPYQRMRAGKHIIFYRIEGSTITVSRILHEKMDFITHLNDP